MESFIVVAIILTLCWMGYGVSMCLCKDTQEDEPILSNNIPYIEI